MNNKHRDILYQKFQLFIKGSFFPVTNAVLDLKYDINAIHDCILDYCDLCLFRKPRRDSLEQHSQQMHEGIWYYCTICDKTLVDKSRIIHHNIYKLQTCDKYMMFQPSKKNNSKTPWGSPWKSEMSLLQVQFPFYKE